MTSGSWPQQLRRRATGAGGHRRRRARPAHGWTSSDRPGWTPPGRTTPSGRDDASRRAVRVSTARKTRGTNRQRVPLEAPTPSPTDQESPGFQESSEHFRNTGWTFGTHSTVLCSGAREDDSTGRRDGQWTGNKVTLSLAIPANSATLVVGAATNSTLGIAAGRNAAATSYANDKTLSPRPRWLYPGRRLPAPLERIAMIKSSRVHCPERALETAVIIIGGAFKPIVDSITRSS